MAITYNPDNDIPDLSGKAIAANSLIDEVHANTTTNDGNSIVTFIPCDQTSLSSVRDAAKLLLAKSQNLIDILICNAGVMAILPALSQDAYEIQFAINHLAHAPLVQLCIPALQNARAKNDGAAGHGRIVVTVGGAWLGWGAPEEVGGIDFTGLKKMQGGVGGPAMLAKYTLYSQSKLANVLHAAELARRYPELRRCYPSGGDCVDGADGAHEFHRPVGGENGCEELRALQFAGGQEKVSLESGGLYEPVGKLLAHTELSADEALAGKLWEWTEKEIEGYLQ
ncbi:hypothetical protein ACJ73_08216 [Blastomyces percursus]|uniref:Oxidoreductase n=1 Tax=Blastomyces percursus TaxID=1658174 RepID=A0A1J9PX08_9EURO|nr:hypothetical protein ACJ73_08216 [Blastomyces percursus]